MGSYEEKKVLLELLRTKSQVDCDSLDISLAKELGPFVDSTSNQADAYLELILPHRKDLLVQSIALAKQKDGEYADLSFEELAVEIAMVKLGLAIAPYITEAIHIMTNPTYTSTSKIVANARRIIGLVSELAPNFHPSRVCIKVVATWEGLQACRELSTLNVHTLATTLFTFEQAILAAECGCTYIAPFVHELKAFFDTSYDDGGANLILCYEIQEYYKRYGYATKVKAAGLLSVEEAKTLAGVTSMTIAPDLLRMLATIDVVEAEVNATSIFEPESQIPGSRLLRRTFIDEENVWRDSFKKAYDGKGEWKTGEAIDIFRDYQQKAEQLMGKPDSKDTFP